MDKQWLERIKERLKAKAGNNEILSVNTPGISLGQATYYCCYLGYHKYDSLNNFHSLMIHISKLLAIKKNKAITIVFLALESSGVCAYIWWGHWDWGFECAGIVHAVVLIR